MASTKTIPAVENLPRGRKENPFEKTEGMRAFCAKWGCSLAQLKLAKEKGCPGFLAGNRMDPLKIIPFIFKLLLTANDLPDGFGTWKEFREMNEARIAEVKRKEAQRLVMDTSEVKRQIGEGVGLMFNELDRRDREQPPALAGRNAVEISERMLADTKAIKKSLTEKFQGIAK